MKIEIPGNYQYNALKSGNPIQRQWHKNKLNLVNYLDFLNHNDAVLDAGCGSGNILLEFAGKVKYIIGIDCNVGCINFLEQRTKNFKVNNVIARTLDLSAVGSLKLKFSKVVMTEVIEHLDEEYLEKTLRELDKVLALEGKILITTPNYRSFWSSMEVVIDTFKILPKLRGEQHIAKYHWEKLLELLRKTNYRVVIRGTLNWVSPFIAPFSKTLADKISYLEFSKVKFGNLLYVVLERNVS